VKYLLNRRGMGRVSCQLIAQHSATGLQIYRNDRPTPPSAEMVIRWGTTTPAYADSEVNKPAAISLGAAKAAFRAKLQGERLCPETWFTKDEVKFPAVVRPATHSRGRDLFVVNNERELITSINACGMGWYATAFVQKSAEYRVYAAQGRAIGVGRKYPANEQSVAWNMAQGGCCKNVRFDEWPLLVVKSGLAALELSGLDFAGVDVIIDREEKPYVLEINSAPTLANYRAQAFAKVFDYMVEHGTEPLPLVERRGGYRKFIHPAIFSEAWV
jgi:glutathione synthase/RimK-type ligase-like ATP-grasp enzyme